MPGGSYRRDRGKWRSLVNTIATERIEILLRQAREMAGKDSRLAKRYVELAKKISMRTKVKIPAAEKPYLCKYCGQPLVPGRNARVRILPGNPRIVITCLTCGKARRFPFNQKGRNSNRSR